ncbi:MAG: acyltransferase [Fuerstiella sp.]
MSPLQKEPKEFLGYVHYFRAIAITYVVGGHAIDAFTWAESSQLERLLRILFCNGSTLFVFIAGYLFQHLSGRFVAGKYFRSKLKNVILPYVVVSIPAIIVFVAFRQRDDLWPGFYDAPLTTQVVMFFLTGTHLATLWFIPMISLIFVLGPILVPLDRNGRLYWLLPVAVVVSAFVNRGLAWQSAIHFFSVYLLGMACSHFRQPVNNFLSQRVVLIAIMAIMGLLIGAELLLTNQTMTYLNYFQKLLLSLFFIGFLFRHNESLTSRFVNGIADTSFGIYFLHAYVIFSFRLAAITVYGGLPAAQILWIVIYTLLVMLVSLALVRFIQRLLGKRSRMLIGS